MGEKIGMISLGCPKNQVDAEMMLAKLKDAGFEITSDESEADAVIVNTCGFIEEAKQEAIENILDVASYKKEGNLKSLIVTGCLAERYKDEIKEQMPEVDVVVGLGSNGDIVSIVKNALNGQRYSTYGEKESLDLCGKRIITTPSYTAYIKIAEGCDNCCTYCAIPQIRGRFRSKPMEDIIFEAEKLADSGVKELIVVAQDTTRYGEDLYGEPKLAMLLTNLCQVIGIHWIRVLYTYPERITNELLRVIAEQPKLVKYMDIPMQHCNKEILRRMNRSGSKEELQRLVERIRILVPGVAVRTTLITGFPGETEEQFEELCEFVKQVGFDRLGCFAYSKEEGTPAADFPDQIDEQIKIDRADLVMNDQLSITIKNNSNKIGSVREVLVEGYDDYIKCYYGRTAEDAPDIDGKVFFMSEQKLEPGMFVNVKINDLIEYDLLGELETK